MASLDPYSCLHCAEESLAKIRSEYERSISVLEERIQQLTSSKESILSRFRQLQEEVEATHHEKDRLYTQCEWTVPGLDPVKDMCYHHPLPPLRHPGTPLFSIKNVSLFPVLDEQDEHFGEVEVWRRYTRKAVEHSLRVSDDCQRLQESRAKLHAEYCSMQEEHDHLLAKYREVERSKRSVGGDGLHCSDSFT